MTRTNLRAALLETAKGGSAASALTRSAPVTIDNEAQGRQASRVGKVNVTGYFPPEVKASLRLVQARKGGTIQSLLAEALNDLFAKYGVPETAQPEGGHPT